MEFDVQELNQDFMLFTTLVKLAQANCLSSLKYLILQVEGAKEEINYPGLYRKIDAVLKKQLTIIV